MVGRRVAHEREQPGSKRRPTFESRLALEDFEINALENIERLVAVPSTAIQSPPIGRLVMLLELDSYSKLPHSARRSTAILTGLVAPEGDSI